MRSLFVLFGLLVGACAPEEINDHNPTNTEFAEVDIESIVPLVTTSMLIGGGGVFTSNSPVLDVGTVVPGELVTLKVGGLSAGQSVAVFAGVPTGPLCGTRPRPAIQPYIGTECLAPAGAVLVGGGTIGWPNELIVRVPVPARLALGRAVEFQAVVIAFGDNPRSNVVQRVATDAWMDCRTELTGQEFVEYGDSGILFGRWSCTTHGNSNPLSGENYLFQNTYSTPDAEFRLYADGQLIGGPEHQNGAYVEFDDTYEFPEGNDVILELVGDLEIPSGPTWEDYLQFSLVRIEAEDVNGDDAPWIGTEAGLWLDIEPLP